MGHRGRVCWRRNGKGGGQVREREREREEPLSERREKRDKLVFTHWGNFVRNFLSFKRVLFRKFLL